MHGFDWELMMIVGGSAGLLAGALFGSRRSLVGDAFVGVLGLYLGTAIIERLVDLQITGIPARFGIAFALASVLISLKSRHTAEHRTQEDV